MSGWDWGEIYCAWHTLGKQRRPAGDDVSEVELALQKREWFNFWGRKPLVQNYKILVRNKINIVVEKKSLTELFKTCHNWH